MLVLVTGATGFLGRQVVRELQERHHTVRCLVHTPGGERIFPGRTTDIYPDIYYGNVTDTEALAEAANGVEIVIHLVAIIRQRRRATFESINHLGAANVVAAAKQTGVKHFVHVSANGVTNDPQFRYLHSKWQGEQEVINSGLPYTILRPTLMFGPGDEFLNTLAGLARIFPLMPVVGPGRNRYQPIAVEDAARCVALSVDRQDLKGKTLDIGGPDQLSYNEIVSLVARTLGKRRWRLHVPVWLMHLATIALQSLQPRPAVTVDQLRMLGIRNVGEPGIVEQTFGFTPRTVEGNIDFIRSVTAADGWKIAMGIMPTRIRDH
ncbi:MAG: hypothetical protein BZY80_00740 [SAR202 cluster bacterium Io17-Chloro-G2]|nr:MAG: hypothetical protein BZY80_00740 [SAR202 cluster bacterium Io17-Chloro-G2]